MSLAIIVCGPSGSGKSTIGKALAERMKCHFAEGDEFHSADNVAKMRSGVALDDKDRLPWLYKLRREVIEEFLYVQHSSVVLACSALKRQYRDILRGVTVNNENKDDKEFVSLENSVERGAIFFVQLCGEFNVIAERMRHRTGHYMPASLLSSQLSTLEEFSRDEMLLYHDGMSVDSTLPVNVIVDHIVTVIMQRFSISNLKQC